MLARRRIYELHAELCRVLGHHHSWTLLQLLRSGTGAEPFAGRAVDPQAVLDLHAALADRLGPDSAWTLVELLREANDSTLPQATDWPSSLTPDPEA
jgi:hypothetical protein